MVGFEKLLSLVEHPDVRVRLEVARRARMLENAEEAATILVIMLGDRSETVSIVAKQELLKLAENAKPVVLKKLEIAAFGKGEIRERARMLMNEIINGGKKAEGIKREDFERTKEAFANGKKRETAFDKIQRIMAERTKRKIF